MAMLAEPRRKQRWTLNPRGKDWSNDSSKFGQRMLEKMGWSAGKGLGANEQGMTEHVQIRVKNDTIGIGFKNDQDKGWTEHQKAFDNFLSHLQENQDSNVIKKVNTKDATVTTESLELKSKQSRARVHYQKFTRGKDVKKYSAKDLADILGGKNILRKEINVEEQQKKDTDVSNTENIMADSFTINRGSITDYFKKKTSHFLKDKDNSNTPSKDTSDGESEQYRGFGFVPKINVAKTKKSKTECNYTFDNPALDLHNTSDTTVIEENIKVLNKRKGEFFTENDVQNLDREQNLAKKIKIDTNVKSCKEGFINMALDLNNQVVESHKRNKFEVPRVQLGLTNDALDLTDETCDKKRVTFNDNVEYSTDSVKKQKFIGKLDKFEVESKKHKKKQKHVDLDISNKIGFVNEALDINAISDESRDNEANEYKSKKSKKQKHQRISNLETIEEASEEGNINNGKETENVCREEFINVEENIHLKKKKKKLKKDIIMFDNTADHIVNIKADVECVNKEGKRKKKEGSKRTKLNDDGALTGQDEGHHINEESIVDINSTETSKLKRKQDKHINKDQDYKLKSRKSKEVAEQKEEINNEKHKTNNESETSNVAVTEKNTTAADIRLQHAEPTKILSRESTINNLSTKINNNSLKERTKVSKRMLKSFLHLNYVSDFPGSNINEIKGYGMDLI